MNVLNPELRLPNWNSIEIQLKFNWQLLQNVLLSKTRNLKIRIHKLREHVLTALTLPSVIKPATRKKLEQIQEHSLVPTRLLVTADPAQTTWQSCAVQNCAHSHTFLGGNLLLMRYQWSQKSQPPPWVSCVSVLNIQKAMPVRIDRNKTTFFDKVVS